MLGFFSFTEVTDPGAHRAYNEWHQLDHLPEQFSLDGVLFGQRWVCSPRCRADRVAVSARLEPCQYMTLYLLRDAEVQPAFFELATRLRAEGRFFADRTSHLSGPFTLRGQWAAPRVLVSAGVMPWRPANGVYVVVGPEMDGLDLTSQPGVAGTWTFVDDQAGRHITVAFIDGELSSAAATLGGRCLGTGGPLEWAGPLERIDASSWDWFDRLTPQ